MRANSKRIKKLTEQALQEAQEFRDSDMKLIVRVWELDMGQEMNPVFKKWFLQEAINPDKITRHRRDFQEHGEYPASEKAERKRYKKFQEVRAEGVSAL